MRYAKSIAAISLLLATIQAFACGPIIYSPAEYYLFHLVNLPDGPDGDYNKSSHENCLLWQQQTSDDIPLDDIYQVVYKYDLEMINTLKSGILPMEAKDNMMARWLHSYQGEQALDFLVLAKNCEWLRIETGSPWYYPSKNDPVRYSLNDVALVARQKTDDYEFGDRYALQAVRAMTSLQQYEEIIDFWNEIEKNFSDGLMRRMTLSYVAGAYYHLNNIEQAKNCYKLANDIDGLLECNLRYQPKMSRVEKMELLYEVYPDCPDFRRQIWEILGRVEPNRDWNDEWSWDWIRDDEKASVEQLGKLCDRVLNENTCTDKALWAYAATYIAHLKGDDRKADHYLKIAENCVKDSNLSDAIKVMRIYIDAQICKYDKAYEQRLFTQLRWLQQLIERDLDEKVIEDMDLYHLTECYSYYYWSDAMRCILLGTVCPKMIQQGNTTLALQLANMSSYSFLNTVNKVEIHFWSDKDIKRFGGNHITFNLYQYRRCGLLNDYDYCNHFAKMADTLSANALIAYTDAAFKPQTEFQKFLNAHSYIDRDYLNELIGTHCLREMHYAEAERYLSKVSSDYFTRTNVYKEGYLNRDPFCVNQRKWNHSVDAKLFFARKMNLLEQAIASTTDPNLKAMLMIDFGMGIRNSFDYCWALTQYRRGWVCYFGSDWEDVDLTQQAVKRADRLLAQAMNAFTDDEYAAQAQLVFCNFKTIAERYPETTAAEIVRGHCDRLVDYHAEKQ